MGQCSGICGERRLTLAERGKMDVLKINDDDDYRYKIQIN